MANFSDEEYKQLLGKYEDKLKSQLDIPIEQKAPHVTFSREYQEFKQEYMPTHLSAYEKMCNFCEKILPLKPDKNKEEALRKSINSCHLNITPTGVSSFALLLPITIIIFGSILGFALTGGLFFVGVSFLIGLALILPLGNLPETLATNWRMQASNQMVLCTFYIVTYMRHTSNLELAIEFASEHLGPPLSLDLKKVLWDVETEKFESIKESLDYYLEVWRETNLEFVEAINLIEGSLYEGAEERRLSLLDKSLDVVLEETYEKMLHYAHNLKGPITMLHMLGIILPILGLVILPLVVSFMDGVKWYHLATLYNVFLPFGIYFLGRSILSKRPTGYGDSDISEENPELKKYKKVLIKLGSTEIQIDPLVIGVLIFSILFVVGISPIILHYAGVADIQIGKNFQLLGYRTAKGTTDVIIGPYGFGASILSLGITLGIGIGLGLYWKLKSKNVIKIRENSKKLEGEFAAALFQLGNRLGDGLPAEIAFGKVADTMRGTISGNFFEIVSTNIRKMGMSVKEAIFNPKSGALIYFPSNLIESSMKVLTESIKKGPAIAAQALTNISRYIKEIHAVNERLQDLMADIISSMKSQINFLTPAISGIVIGITSMITTILGKLGEMMPTLAEGQEGGGAMAGLTDMFGDGVPTFYFQIVVGLYVIQIAYILTVLTNGIENGSDKLSEEYLLGNNMLKSAVLYSAIACIVMVIFNLVAGAIMVKP
jgi:hypothetical protein